jgi:hypothetical protein
MFRLCNECKRNLPLQEFLPQRDYTCKECKELKEIRRTTIGEIAQAKELMGQLMTGVGDGTAKSAPKLDEICGLIVDKFGGPDAFVNRWHEQFTVALNNNPGSTKNLQHFVAVFRLISEANKNKRDDDVSRMTGEQIQQEQKRLLLETLLEAAGDDKRKEIAAKLFENLGLTHKEIKDNDLIQAIE